MWGDAKSEVSVFDSALKIAHGADTIGNFGSNYLLVTTSKITDGIISFGADATQVLRPAAASRSMARRSRAWDIPAC